MALVPPHGGKGLVCSLLQDAELAAEQKKAAGLRKIDISPRAKGDLIMIGISGFSPLNGFMTKADLYQKTFCTSCSFLQFDTFLM